VSLRPRQAGSLAYRTVRLKSPTWACVIRAQGPSGGREQAQDIFSAPTFFDRPNRATSRGLTLPEPAAVLIPPEFVVRQSLAAAVLGVNPLTRRCGEREAPVRLSATLRHPIHNDSRQPSVINRQSSAVNHQLVGRIAGVTHKHDRLNFVDLLPM